MSWLLALLPAWATGWLGSRLALQVGIGLIFVLLVLAVLLRVLNIGKKAAMTEVLNAQIKRMRDRLELKDRQLEAANRRPRDRADLERMLESGEF